MTLPRAIPALLGLLTALLLLPLGAAAQPPQHSIRPPAWIPTTRLLAPEARLPIELKRVQVRATLTGLAAATRIEFELHNPNERVLEAELQFPLLEGQVVTGFALDIQGELRPAVPVEKAKGRQVFEDVIRARVDPALLEATVGNNYKLRIYPLPARGSRRVVLEIGESIRASEQPSWRLPLRFGGAVGQLDVAVQVDGLPPPALSAQLGAARLPLRAQRQGGSELLVQRQHYRGADELRLSLPREPAAGLISTALFRDAHYFYAELAVPTQRAARARPATLALIWDASGSGAARDHGRELALLDAYLRSLGEVEVLLQTVRDTAEPVERFVVRAGQWPALRRRLEAMVYDGATNLGAMTPPAEAQTSLLFSDGLGNYGTADALPRPRGPLFALNAASSAAPAGLRRVAEASGGAYLDLLALPTAQALQILSSEQTRLLGLGSNGADELESASVYPEGGRLLIAGRLREATAEILVELAAPGGARQTRRLRVQSAEAAPGQPGPALAAHRWAALRMARLEAEGERHRAAIRRLGADFGMVSSETSLIVLDSAADYARHEIEPPAALRAEWQQLMATQAQRRARAGEAQIERVVAEFADYRRWWEKEQPKDAPPAPPQSQRMAPTSVAPSYAMPPPAPAPAAMAAPAVMAARAAQYEAESGQRAAPVPRTAAPAPPPGEQAATGAATIRLQKWSPDAPYARRLRAAPAADLYAIYLDERPVYTASTAFFLDAADILAERGQPALAARVLSNLAEMALENRHVLRILAYRLLQLKQVEQALPLLERVERLSPDEPQSLRDLGLALAQAGQDQAAIDKLWEVVARPWNNRFPGIELIALAELNAINARRPGLDTRRIDARLLRSQPLDLRAVLSWDADNTDIDLWVIDPNGERAYYGHRFTYQGGRMSEDFTGGYGPEEFSLRRAKPGTYTIKAQFYGHRQQLVAPAATLMLRLSSGFGTPAQKDEEVILRLSGQGQEVTVGSFEIKP